MPSDRKWVPRGLRKRSHTHNNSHTHTRCSCVLCVTHQCNANFASTVCPIKHSLRPHYAAPAQGNGLLTLHDALWRRQVILCISLFASVCTAGWPVQPYRLSYALKEKLISQIFQCHIQPFIRGRYLCTQYKRRTLRDARTRTHTHELLLFDILVLQYLQHTCRHTKPPEEPVAHITLNSVLCIACL